MDFSGKNPTKETWKKGVYEPDIIKEKEIRGVIKKKTRTILSGKNLFIDLVERINHEFNATNCWTCGDTRMAEIWPWEEIALSPQETLKLLRKKEEKITMSSERDERDY